MSEPQPLAPGTGSPGKTRRLAALNIALLAVLALVSVAARAERGQPVVRGRGDYTMVGGKIQGGTGNAVYIVDSANQQLIAVRWNDSRKALEGIDYRNLAQDAGANAGQIR
jgi:hypothetical protein